MLLLLWTVLGCAASINTALTRNVLPPDVKISDVELFDFDSVLWARLTDPESSSSKTAGKDSGTEVTNNQPEAEHVLHQEQSFNRSPIQPVVYTDEKPVRFSLSLSSPTPEYSTSRNKSPLLAVPIYALRNAKDQTPDDLSLPDALPLTQTQSKTELTHVSNNNNLDATSSGSPRNAYNPEASALLHDFENEATRSDNGKGGLNTIPNLLPEAVPDFERNRSVAPALSDEYVPLDLYEEDQGRGNELPGELVDRAPFGPAPSFSETPVSSFGLQAGESSDGFLDPSNKVRVPLGKYYPETVSDEAQQGAYRQYTNPSEQYAFRSDDHRNDVSSNENQPNFPKDQYGEPLAYGERIPPSDGYAVPAEYGPRSFPTDYPHVSLAPGLRAAPTDVSSVQHENPPDYRLSDIPKDPYGTSTEDHQDNAQTSQQENPEDYRQQDIPTNRYEAAAEERPRDRYDYPGDHQRYGLPTSEYTGARNNGQYTDPPRYYQSDIPTPRGKLENAIPEKYANPYSEHFPQNSQTPSVQSIHTRNSQISVQAPDTQENTREGFPGFTDGSQYTSSTPAGSYSSSKQPYGYASEAGENRGDSRENYGSSEGLNSYGTLPFPHYETGSDNSTVSSPSAGQNINNYGSYPSSSVYNTRTSRNQGRAFPSMREQIYVEMLKNIPPLPGYFGEQQGTDGGGRTLPPNRYLPGDDSGTVINKQRDSFAARQEGTDREYVYPRQDETIMQYDYDTRSGFNPNGYPISERSYGVSGSPASEYPRDTLEEKQPISYESYDPYRRHQFPQYSRNVSYGVYNPLQSASGRTMVQSPMSFPYGRPIATTPNNLYETPSRTKGFYPQNKYAYQDASRNDDEGLYPLGSAYEKSPENEDEHPEADRYPSRPEDSSYRQKNEGDQNDQNKYRYPYVSRQGPDSDRQFYIYQHGIQPKPVSPQDTIKTPGVYRNQLTPSPDPYRNRNTDGPYESQNQNSGYRLNNGQTFRKSPPTRIFYDGDLASYQQPQQRGGTADEYQKGQDAQRYTGLLYSQPYEHSSKTDGVTEVQAFYIPFTRDYGSILNALRSGGYQQASADSAVSPGRYGKSQGKGSPQTYHQVSLDDRSLLQNSAGQYDAAKKTDDYSRFGRSQPGTNYDSTNTQTGHQGKDYGRDYGRSRPDEYEYRPDGYRPRDGYKSGSRQTGQGSIPPSVHKDNRYLSFPTQYKYTYSRDVHKSFPDPRDVHKSSPDSRDVHKSFPDSRDVHKSFPDSRDVYKSIPDSRDVYKSFPDSRDVHKSFPDFRDVYKSTPDSRDVYKSFPDSRDVHKSFPDPRDVHKSFPDSRHVYKSSPDSRDVYKSFPDSRDVHKSSPDSRDVYKSFPDSRDVYKSFPDSRDVYKSFPDSRDVYKSFPDSRDLHKSFSDSRDVYKSFPDSKGDVYESFPHSRDVHKSFPDSREAYKTFPNSRDVHKSFPDSSDAKDSLSPPGLLPLPNSAPTGIRSNQEVGVTVVRGPFKLQDPVLSQAAIQMQRRL
ncbi:hypothetical protein BaRGS_00003147 [Batillaria attramentaria]|uniref:Adhesive plaque matrix protein-like n=1 Tax=Batillaria attramentaria TaxID=370345 RepID=A0ABD0M3I1_9CAEN